MPSAGTETLMGKEKGESLVSVTPSMSSSLSSSRPLLHNDFTAPLVAATLFAKASLPSEKSLCGSGAVNVISGMLPAAASVSGSGSTSFSRICSNGTLAIEHSESMEGNVISMLPNDDSGWYSPSNASNSAMVAIGTVGKPSSSSSSRPRLQITRNSIGVVGASASRRKSVDNVDGRRVNIAYSNAAICRIASCSRFSKA